MGNISASGPFAEPVSRLGDYDQAVARTVYEKYLEHDLEFGINNEDLKMLLKSSGIDVDEALVEGIMGLFPNMATLNVLDFIEGFSLLCKGSYEEKVNLIFDVFDFQQRGEISFDELTIMLMCCARGLEYLSERKINRNNKDSDTIDDEKVAEMLRYDFGQTQGMESDISKEQYLGWVKEKGPSNTAVKLDVLISFMNGTPLSETEYNEDIRKSANAETNKDEDINNTAKGETDGEGDKPDTEAHTFVVAKAETGETQKEQNGVEEKEIPENSEIPASEAKETDVDNITEANEKIEKAQAQDDEAKSSESVPTSEVKDTKVSDNEIVNKEKEEANSNDNSENLTQEEGDTKDEPTECDSRDEPTENEQEKKIRCDDEKTIETIKSDTGNAAVVDDVEVNGKSEESEQKDEIQSSDNSTNNVDKVDPGSVPTDQNHENSTPFNDKNSIENAESKQEVKNTHDSRTENEAVLEKPSSSDPKPSEIDDNTQNTNEKEVEPEKKEGVKKSENMTCKEAIADKDKNNEAVDEKCEESKKKVEAQPFDLVSAVNDDPKIVELINWDSKNTSEEKTETKENEDTSDDVKNANIT